MTSGAQMQEGASPHALNSPSSAASPSHSSDQQMGMVCKNLWQWNFLVRKRNRPFPLALHQSLRNHHQRSYHQQTSLSLAGHLPFLAPSALTWPSSFAALHGSSVAGTFCWERCRCAWPERPALLEL